MVKLELQREVRLSKRSVHSCRVWRLDWTKPTTLPLSRLERHRGQIRLIVAVGFWDHQPEMHRHPFSIDIPSVRNSPMCTCSTTSFDTFWRVVHGHHSIWFPCFFVRSDGRQRTSFRANVGCTVQEATKLDVDALWALKRMTREFVSHFPIFFSGFEWIATRWT